MGRRKVFKDLESAWNTDKLWNDSDLLAESHRLFKHTKYFDKVHDDTVKALPEYTGFQDSYEKDLFILLYGSENQSNPNADWLNRRLTEEIKKCKGFPALKTVCENREMFALTASVSLFCSLTGGVISDLITNTQINQWLEVIDDLQEKIKADFRYIRQERAEIKTSTVQQQKKFLNVLNRLHDRQEQCKNLYVKLEEYYLLDSQIRAETEMAVQKATEDVNEIRNILISWGNGEGTVGCIPFDNKVLVRVKQDPQLRDISKFLGKYKEMLIEKRKNEFTYGEGEKYDLTTGNDINACLSADMALLSTPQTQPLFIHKFMNSSLTQYRKREAVTRAKGDIIACIDGSGSMSDTIAWAMALALALQKIAAEDKRKFALIQFGNKEQLRLNEFIPGVYTQAELMDAASHFFNGGTNFERPLDEAMKMIEQGYQDAEIVFITDGKCKISEDFAKGFTEFRESHKLTVTGILLDDSDSNCGDSLRPFCNRIYRTSTTDSDDIAAALLRQIDDGEAA